MSLLFTKSCRKDTNDANEQSLSGLHFECHRRVTCVVTSCCNKRAQKIETSFFLFAAFPFLLTYFWAAPRCIAATPPSPLPAIKETQIQSAMLARIARKELVCLEKRAVLWNAPHVIIQHESFATNAAASASSPRRLRRLKPTRSRWDDEFKMPDTGGLEEAFTPEEDNFGDYLKKVSLSPWVPTPDPVARRVFDLLNAGPDDVSLLLALLSAFTFIVYFFTNRHP